MATHFPAADDTIACALASVRAHCPWVQQLGPAAVVTDYSWPPLTTSTEELVPPKYWKWGVDENGKPAQVSDPRAQLDLTTVIEPGADTYCPDGY